MTTPTERHVRARMRTCRHLRQVVAYFTRTFWVPCPICRSLFGGHEFDARTAGTIDTNHPSGVSRGICPGCVAARLEDPDSLCDTYGHQLVLPKDHTIVDADMMRLDTVQRRVIATVATPVEQRTSWCAICYRAGSEIESP